MSGRDSSAMSEKVFMRSAQKVEIGGEGRGGFNRESWPNCRWICVQVCVCEAKRRRGV